jgi:hypothetical protein
MADRGGRAGCDMSCDLAQVNRPYGVRIQAIEVASQAGAN